MSIENVSVALSVARKLHKNFNLIQYSEPQQIFKRDTEENEEIHFHHLCVFHLLNNNVSRGRKSSLEAAWRYYSFTAVKLSKQKRKSSSEETTKLHRQIT